MDQFKSLFDILNRCKYEHEVTVGITEKELNLDNNEDIYDKLIQIKYSLNLVMFAMDDVKMLSVIKEFLDISERERLDGEASLIELKYESEKLNTELNFLTTKFKRNEEQMNKLQSENIRLKTDLSLNNVRMRSKTLVDDKVNLISPSYINSSFKFEIDSTKAKKFRENDDGMVIPQKLKTLYDLVMHYSIKGNYAVAIPLCDQAMVDIAKTSGKYSNDYASILHVLANVFRDIGDYQKSVGLMLEVLLIEENLPEYSKIKVIETLHCITILYELLYCWKEAATYCRRCIAVMRETYAANDIRIAERLQSMALIYRNDDQMTNAIVCLEECLVIYGAHRLFYRLDVARVQSQIASCYLSQNQLDISLNLYKQVLSNCYQLHLSEIWGFDKPLWEIAEELEGGLGSTGSDIKYNYVDIRLMDGLDEPGLRDNLMNMSIIYRQLGMNKAAAFLETWPDRNIPAPNVPSRIVKSRSLIHLNEEIDLRNSHPPNYYSPVTKGLRTNLVRSRRASLAKRSSISVPRQSRDIDITIYESWSTPFVRNRSDYESNNK